MCTWSGTRLTLGMTNYYPSWQFPRFWRLFPALSEGFLSGGESCLVLIGARLMAVNGWGINTGKFVTLGFKYHIVIP